MEKHNFYFIRANGEYLLLAENVEEKEAMRAKQEFLNKHNYHSYYTRSWTTEEGTMYDVGSHTEFFFWGEHNNE